ncbi:hypothetical protein J1N35_040726 [Gossypium stocksii]|uniref:Ycf2 N-terminal domain-containing protein n=1 Tax=Gossypium stocksii TaxID=47602 RepID=A0A9D3ZIS6_9ROSI|nr:hypothetical protein J1N35_040726 [Gossypium stocksii]
MDDSIRKDHDWELFDRLSPSKRRNIINLNSGQLFEILVKDWICYLMFAFREKIPIEVEGFFKQQGAGSTIQLNDHMKNVTDSFVSLGHWPSAGSFGVNTDILATNPINLSVVLGVLIFFGKGVCASCLFQE